MFFFWHSIDLAAVYCIYVWFWRNRVTQYQSSWIIIFFASTMWLKGPVVRERERGWSGKEREKYTCLIMSSSLLWIFDCYRYIFRLWFSYVCKGGRGRGKNDETPSMTRQWKTHSERASRSKQICTRYSKRYTHHTYLARFIYINCIKAHLDRWWEIEILCNTARKCWHFECHSPIEVFKFCDFLR